MKKPYYITYYNGIPKSFCCEERYKEAIDCGFDILTAESQDLKITQDMLRYCETMGVRVNVYDSRITDIVYNNWETRLDDPETLEATIKEICEDYRDYPALYCYSIIDEPSSDKFPLLGKMVELFRKYDPAHFCYINLFPEGCTEEQLGNATYDAHLQAFADTVKPALMSNDRYHLLADNRPEENITITDEATAKAYAARLNRIDIAGYYNNLEIIRKYALENNLPYMLIILLTEHGWYRYLTREEIRYEVFQTLAYGCSTLSYFTYWTPPMEKEWRFQNGIISHDGIKTQHYYDVQSLNAEIRPIGDCIANTVSEAVFHVGDEADNVRFFSGYGDIRDITGGRYTVGFFADGSFLIANKDYLQESVCTVDTDAVLEVFDTEKAAFVPVKEKQFTLPAGGGVYLRKQA